MDYLAIHDKITDAYYNKKTITKNQFDKYHQAIWLYFERDEIDAGRMPAIEYKPNPYGDPIPVYRSDDINAMLASNGTTRIALEAILIG